VSFDAVLVKAETDCSLTAPLYVTAIT